MNYQTKNAFTAVASFLLGTASALAVQQSAPAPRGTGSHGGHYVEMSYVQAVDHVVILAEKNKASFPEIDFAAWKSKLESVTYENREKVYVNGVPKAAETFPLENPPRTVVSTSLWREASQLDKYSTAFHENMVLLKLEADPDQQYPLTTRFRNLLTGGPENLKEIANQSSVDPASLVMSLRNRGYFESRDNYVQQWQVDVYDGDVRIDSSKVTRSYTQAENALHEFVVMQQLAQQRQKKILVNRAKDPLGPDYLRLSQESAIQEEIVPYKLTRGGAVFLIKRDNSMPLFQDTLIYTYGDLKDILTGDGFASVTLKTAGEEIYNNTVFSAEILVPADAFSDEGRYEYTSEKRLRFEYQCEQFKEAVTAGSNKYISILAACVSDGGRREKTLFKAKLVLKIRPEDLVRLKDE